MAYEAVVYKDSSLWYIEPIHLESATARLVQSVSPPGDSSPARVFPLRIKMHKTHKRARPVPSRSQRTPLCKKKLAIGVRCYDNGGPDSPTGTVDRYTVVYTGRYRRYSGGEQLYVGMDAHPLHPMGFGQHGASVKAIDVPVYSHLGKKIEFSDLPKQCQLLVMADCQELAEGNANV